MDGPSVQIFLRSRNISPILSATASGEMWDLPSHPIYTEDPHPSLPNPPDSVSIVGKRQDSRPQGQPKFRRCTGEAAQSAVLRVFFDV